MRRGLHYIVSMTQQGNSPESPVRAGPQSAQQQWIGRREIAAIQGALKPGAYVARAYKFEQEHGGNPPPWARKLDNGRRLFDENYVRADAQQNLESIGISEAAKLLGLSRKALWEKCKRYGITKDTNGQEEG